MGDETESAPLPQASSNFGSAEPAQQPGENESKGQKALIVGVRVKEDTNPTTSGDQEGSKPESHPQGLAENEAEGKSSAKTSEEAPQLPSADSAATAVEGGEGLMAAEKQPKEQNDSSEATGAAAGPGAENSNSSAVSQEQSSQPLAGESSSGADGGVSASDKISLPNADAAQASTGETPSQQSINGQPPSHAVPHALPSQSLLLFVSGIHPEVTVEELVAGLAPYAEAGDLDVKMDVSTGRNAGYAYVTVRGSSVLSRDALVRAKPVLRGLAVDIREMPSTSSEEETRAPQFGYDFNGGDRYARGYYSEPYERVPSRTKIFLGGLTQSVTDEILYQHFSQFGQVERANVIRDETGRSRGFGFVLFLHEGSATAAVAASPHNLNEDNWQVDARPAQERGSRRGGRSPHPYYGMAAAYGSPYGCGYLNPYAYAQAYAQYAGAYAGAFAQQPYLASAYGNAVALYGHQAQQQAAQTYGSTTSPDASSAGYGAVRRGDTSEESSVYGYNANATSGSATSRPAARDSPY